MPISFPHEQFSGTKKLGPFSMTVPGTQNSIQRCIDSQSSRFIDDLSKGDFSVNIDNWSILVYYINSDSVPKVNVINSRPGIYGKGFADPIIFPYFPISSHHLPSEIFSDNHLCISRHIEND